MGTERKVKLFEINTVHYSGKISFREGRRDMNAIHYLGKIRILGKNITHPWGKSTIIRPSTLKRD